MSKKKIVIIKPFDAHLHLRVGEMALLVTPMSAKQFSDVIVMPNLTPPVKTVEEAMIYRKRLVSYDKTCDYHMTLYLTESTTAEEVQKVSEHPNMIGLKLYPLNATTGSQDGISDIEKVYPLFEEMQRLGVPLLIHGEVIRQEISILDREKVFIEEVLTDLVIKFPRLRITMEHITTKDAVDFVKSTENVVATMTGHHLHINHNAIFTVDGMTGINPHNFCLPIAKLEEHRLALVEAATSGDPKFFAGTDSAPHTSACKISECGCAGCFTGLHAVELYTTVFAEADKLDKLENFLSIYGRIHYGIEIPDGENKRSKKTITINREEFKIPKNLGENGLRPFKYGETLDYKVESE